MLVIVCSIVSLLFNAAVIIEILNLASLSLEVVIRTFLPEPE